MYMCVCVYIYIYTHIARIQIGHINMTLKYYPPNMKQIIYIYIYI